MKNIVLLMILILLSACSAPASTATIPTLEPATIAPAATLEEAPQSDYFSENLITLPSPRCDGTLTPQQTEGPYYAPNAPERNSLLEEDVVGTRLIMVDYVLNQDCQPIANAWLDFWQADASGNYDNEGYVLRGHQFTDSQGRYFLETVIPGEYPNRTQHIHVKIQPQNGQLITSQLYFPDSAGNATDGIFDPALLVILEDRGEYTVAYYNFVVSK